MNKKMFVLSLLLVMAFIANACGSAATSAAPAATDAPAVTEAPAATDAPAAGPVVLKIAYNDSPTTFDPIASFSTESQYLGNVYEQLLRINPPGSAEAYTPLLATSWESSADALTWTFHLREGVKFHDGEPMNADAVKKSIETAKASAGASFIWAPLDTIEAVDASTVVFHLKYAAAIDLIASSLYGAWIVSPKALDAFAADSTYWDKGIDAGTGPYTIESYTPDAEIVFAANENYWGGWDGPHYNKVVAQIVPEATTQQQMLEGGEADLVQKVPNEAYASFESNPDYTVKTEPSFFNYVGYFNTTKKPLDDVKVRQALSYAIPYADIIKIGAFGRGTQSFGPVPAGVFPFDNTIPQYTYDIEKAKALLKEAGHESGGFSINLTYASSNPAEERFAPLIKDSFAQIGVDVTVTPMAFGEQWDLAKADPAKAQDMFIVLYWPTYSDAGSDNLWSLFHSSEKPFFNLSYWKNDDYDKLIDDAGALTATDRAAAQAKYTEAMKILVDQAPGVFFYDTTAIHIIPKNIEGYVYNLNYPFVDYFFYELHPAK